MSTPETSGSWKTSSSVPCSSAAGRSLTWRTCPPPSAPDSAAPPIPYRRNLPGVLAEIERQAIQSALDRSGGVQTQAAGELGISERVLRYKMKKYELEGRSG